LTLRIVTSIALWFASHYVEYMYEGCAESIQPF